MSRPPERPLRAMRTAISAVTMRAMTTSVNAIGSAGEADHRQAAGLAWAREALARPGLSLAPLAGDASFRRYFRLHGDRDSWVLMDAPPDREDSRPFVDVAGRLRSAGIHAPAIVAADLDRGFLLLEDLGDTLLRETLTPDSAETWMPRLLDLLTVLGRRVDAAELPAYDRKRLQDELELFPEWYLGRHQGITLNCAQLDLWEDLCTRLLLSAERQPQGFVHRDFHSCNLLVRDDGDLAVIDFQDAVRGPVSYDLASLLWDRYITWPRARVEAWTDAFRIRVAPGADPADWQRAVDWMGLQRNLKIVGIFARLHYRDGKDGYLELLPRFWDYVRDALRRTPEFRPFDDLLEQLACAP